MSRVVERVMPWFGAAALGAAILTGWLVSVGTGVLVVAGGLVVAILVVGYLAIESLLSEGEELSTVADVAQSELMELDREKAAILSSIRELENERDLGKISPVDFEALDAFFRKRAVDVMKKIDRDLSSWRKRAESMVAERVEKVGSAARAKKAASLLARSAPAPEPRGTPEGVIPAPAEAALTAKRPCGACDTPIDPESNFCKKCGKRVTCSCGAALDVDSNFCKKCGAKVEAHG
jgi:hypothetical protein